VERGEHAAGDRTAGSGVTIMGDSLIGTNRGLGAQAADDSAARARLGELMLGNFATQLIYIAAKLGIADCLKDGALSVEELAAKTGTNRRALGEMTRALVALEVLAEREGGRVGLTAVGELLRNGWQSQVILVGEEYFRASAELLHTARTGERAFNRAFGMGFYDYLGSHAEAAERFNEVMLLSAPIRYADVPAACDFSRVSVLVDVGAGYGGLASIILKAAPAMRAILFDSPRAIAGARKFLEAAGLAARCEFVAGDFFESVPRGGDTYLTSSVLSNWDDERALRLLRNCRAASSSDARLVLVEPGFSGEQPSRYTALFTVAARAIQGSVIRSEPEYRALLDAAGFSMASIRPLACEPWMLIEAVPH
jgi:SAM-dependent methyltransferase